MATATAHDSHHGETKVDTLMGLKIALIFILFFICYLGLIPVYSKYCKNSQLTLSLMNCFAGGVFLSMAFIHILPEAVEQYYDTMLGVKDEHDSHRLLQATATIIPTANSNTTVSAVAEEEEHADRHGIFPLPYLLFFAGYCLVLLVDRVLAGEYGHSHGGHDHHSHTEEDLKNPIGSERQLKDNEKAP